jgi:hypothetical protein
VRGVLDVAAAVAEAGLEELGMEAVEGVQVRDFGGKAPNGTNGHVADEGTSDDGDEEDALLPAGARAVPHAAALLEPAPGPPAPGPSARFAHATQVRLTQLALAEVLDGGENVGELWRDAFAWFAARRGDDRGACCQGHGCARG